MVIYLQIAFSIAKLLKRGKFISPLLFFSLRIVFNFGGMSPVTSEIPQIWTYVWHPVPYKSVFLLFNIPPRYPWGSELE